MVSLLFYRAFVGWLVCCCIRSLLAGWLFCFPCLFVSSFVYRLVRFGTSSEGLAQGRYCIICFLLFFRRLLFAVGRPRRKLVTNKRQSTNNNNNSQITNNNNKQ